VILTTGLDKDDPSIVSVPEDTAAPGGAPGDHGKAVFAQYCSACHGASGEGSVGPPLKGESARKNLAEAVTFIKDPKTPMPKLFPAPLSEQDVAAVAAFVESLK
jgi:mono/diheme cytochrome c family protein